MSIVLAHLLVAGDLHGDYDGEMRTLNSKNFSEKKELTKNDVLFQLGDFGYYWYYPDTFKIKEDIRGRERMAALPCTVIIIPGNHENYDLINNLPVIELFGGKVYVDYTKEGPLYIAVRGSVFNVHGKTIFTFSGAQTNNAEKRFSFEDYENKKCKKYQIDFWSQELPTEEEIEFAWSELEKVNYKVDYVLSHTAPNSILGEFIHINNFTDNKLLDPVAEVLEDMYNMIEFEEWHFGHIHTNYKYIDSEGKIFQSHYFRPPHFIY